MGVALKMLLVDDHSEDSEWMVRELRKEFPGLKVEQITAEDAFRLALERGDFDLVVAECRLAWGSGADITRAVKARLPHCPVLLVTSAAHRAAAKEALQYGADDYLLKSEKKIYCLPIAVRGVLERSRLRRQLSTCDADFRRFITAAPIAMAVSDAQGRVILLNCHFVTTFGYDLGEIPNLHAWWLKVSPDAQKQESASPFLRDAQVNGAPNGNARCRITCKDGSLRTVEVSRILSGNRELVMLNDMTQLSHADEKLLHLEAIVQSTDDAIFSKTLEGIITSWNRGAERIYGYSTEEVLGQSILMLVPQGDEDELRQILERVRRGEHIEHLETRRVRKDGTLIYMSLTMSPIMDEQGRVHSISVIGSDVTYRKSLELQLRQAQKMEALGTLSGGIAHDFNNILTAIIGHASLLAMKMDPADPLSSNVHQILDASGRAANLTQSLLAFSRKKPIETKPVELNGIMLKVEKLLVQLMREDIDFKCAPCQEDLTVLADPGQIEQVLINLATNARDALRQGGIIRISTSLVELDREFVRIHGYGRPGRYASLSFSDNGAGMDAATRQRIFEPFFTTKDVGRGTGLGLSIVYGIIKQHNGYINCYSEPGEGTTFQVYLPLTRSAVEEPQRGAPEAPAALGSETILMAEDDAATRSMNRELLENFGYKIIEAVDGEDAVTKFREHGSRVKLLFFDAIMPKKNGREAYREIVREAPGVKVLFTSGYAADIFDEKEKAGPNFIPKPIIPTVLLKRIREILDAK